MNRNAKIELTLLKLEKWLDESIQEKDTAILEKIKTCATNFINLYKNNHVAKQVVGRCQTMLDKIAA